ncbi:hypothetical protein LQG66_16520 [Bradyrhizobium ontarionense]|uniref:Heme-binding protein n=1 Tax=Bradyrhizobium ontarionense TaxID=2898149 RepID=A0ABY3RLY3_9BRAD|nr:hypothetical protein [Bradyrhizobium sp. A19]UFZ07807.1 hypothetical protein LQG66_16520 [Bradyrhizobium sp. A19]
MTRHSLTQGLICGLLVMVGPTVAAAQSAPAVVAADQLGNIQTAINKAIGAQAKTIEITTDGNVLVVARVNSNMNASTHEGRNNEAKTIAAIVAGSIGGSSGYGTMSTIRVDYMTRAKASSKAASRAKIVDRVEFRKGPDSVFDFHQT